jgi:hypothetical protein
MAQTTEKPAAAGYTRPTIVDHGSLEALTADFDLHFVGSVAKLVTIAAASPPIGGGGGGDPTPQGEIAMQPPPEGGPPPLPDGGPPPSGGGPGPDDLTPGGATLGETEQGGGGDILRGSGGEPAGGQGGAPGGGGVRQEVAGAGGLPFTGYAAWAAAALGAAMTTSGVVLRGLVRRRRP